MLSRVHCVVFVRVDFGSPSSVRTRALAHGDATIADALFEFSGEYDDGPIALSEEREGDIAGQEANPPTASPRRENDSTGVVLVRGVDDSLCDISTVANLGLDGSPGSFERFVYGSEDTSSIAPALFDAGLIRSTTGLFDDVDGDHSVGRI